MKKLNIRFQNLILIQIVFLFGFLITAKAEFQLAPVRPDQQYTVLIVAPHPDSISSEQKLAIERVKARLKDSYEVITKNFAGNLFTNGGVKTVIWDVASSLQSHFAEDIQSINQSLPREEPLVLSLYLVPWDRVAPPQPSTSNGSPVSAAESSSVEFLSQHLQFLELDWNQYSTRADFYAKVTQNIREPVAGTTSQFRFIASAIQISLERNNSSVQAQLFGSIKPQITEFKKSNEQVVLDTLHVLNGDHSSDAPTALLSIRQKLALNDADAGENKPEVKIEFGLFGGLSGGIGGWQGQMQVYRDVFFGEDCRNNLNSLPSLIGVLGPKAMGGRLGQLINRFIQNRRVQFRILDLSFDATTLQVNGMRVSTEIGNHRIPQCLNSSAVNEDFKAEVNEEITATIKSLYNQDDITDDLMDALYK